MSSTTTEAVEHDTHEGGHKHPTDGDYVKIALILGVITALEVGTYFVELNTAVVFSLIAMMIAKFVIVIGYFMHLKYDNPIFKRIFVFGLVLAVVVYMIVFFAFEYWDERYLRFLQRS